jgi:hypothetical protein
MRLAAAVSVARRRVLKQVSSSSTHAALALSRARSLALASGDPKVAAKWRNEKLQDDPVKESNKRVSSV